MTLPDMDRPETQLAELRDRVLALEARLNAQAEQLHQQELALRVLAGLPEQATTPAADTVPVMGANASTPPTISPPAPRFAANETKLSSRDLLRELAINSIDQPLIGLDVDRTVLFWNQAATRLFGWKEIDVLGCRLPFVPLDQSEDLEEFLEDAQLGTPPSPWDFQLLTYAGERRSVRLAAIPGPEQTLVLLLSPSEPHRPNMPPRELHPLERRYITLGRMTVGVTHDLNNLLAVAQGNAELLAVQLQGLPALSRQVQDLLATSTAAIELCRNLTRVVRHEPGLPNRCELISTLQRLKPVLRAVVGSKVRLGIDLPDAACVIGLSSTDTLQLVLNLLTNAFNAVQDLDSPQIEMKLEILGEPSHEVCLSVLDNGRGFDVAAHQQMSSFQEQPYLYGVGLTTVRHLVEQAYGQMAIESEVGQGTLVKIQLPRV